MDIYVTLSTFAVFSDEPLDLLKKSGYQFEINDSGKRMTPDEILAKAPDAKVLVAGVEPYERSTLCELASLLAISRCGVGIDSIDKDAAKELDVAILNTPDEPTQAVAELTLTMILALLKRLPKVDKDTHDRLWQRTTGSLLSGKKVGIVGFGRIGRKVGSLLSAFGVEILVFDPYCNAFEDDVHWCSSLDDLFGQSDIVTLHASSSDGFLIGEKEVDSMRDGAWLVNLARGNMIDEAALLSALEQNKLSGAALDVYSEEPYKAELCDCDKIIMTPHQSTLTYETRTAMEVKAVRNAIEFLDKQ